MNEDKQRQAKFTMYLLPLLNGTDSNTVFSDIVSDIIKWTHCQIIISASDALAKVQAILLLRCQKLKLRKEIEITIRKDVGKFIVRVARLDRDADVNVVGDNVATPADEKMMCCKDISAFQENQHDGLVKGTSLFSVVSDPGCCLS